MAAPKKHAYLRNLIAIGLVLGVALGLTGWLVPEGHVQQLFYALSSFCIIIGTTLLGSKLTREDHDIPAAGFIVLGIGNAMLYGFLATHDAGNEQWGAGIMIYVPGLLLVSLYDRSHVVLRVLGFVSAASFGVLALMIFMGADVSGVEPLLRPLAYNTMSAVLVWWAWLVYRTRA